MKAVRRSAEVKVVKSSAAVVRNSVLHLMDEVLTWTALPWLVETDVEVFGFALACAAVEEVILLIGVETPLVGPEPGACWISLPCSAIRAGARD